jgi:hypothetical protein
MEWVKVRGEGKKCKQEEEWKNKRDGDEYGSQVPNRGEGQQQDCVLVCSP